MNDTSQYQPEPPQMRRSAKVALVLLGAAGVVGVGALAMEAWHAVQGTDDVASQPSAPRVSATQTYANNDFIPGVGYYHAPYYGWYQYPFNYHDPARGYFAGGLWQMAPFVLSVMASRPSNEAVMAALAVQRARDEQIRQQPRSSSWFGSSSGSSSRSWFSSSPSSTTSSTTGSAPASKSWSAPSTPSKSAPSVAPRSAPSSSPSSGSHSIQRGGFGSSGHSSGGSS